MKKISLNNLRIALPLVAVFAAPVLLHAASSASEAHAAPSKDQPSHQSVEVNKRNQADTEGYGEDGYAEAGDAEDDDFDPLAELAGLGDAMAEEGLEGGGSIRAKRVLDPTLAKRLKDPRNYEGKVVMVKQGKFPNVAIKVKISRTAKQRADKSLKRNSTVVLIPSFKRFKKRAQMSDPETRLNAGAYYLRTGDRVVFRLAEGKKNAPTKKSKQRKAQRATYIERKK